MAEPMPQTLQNHTRWVPLYHFVSAPIFILNLVWALYLLVTGFSAHTVFGALFAFALMFTFLCARTFASSAQDRIIRLEERMRLRELLPDDLQARINDFTTSQLDSAALRQRRRAAGPGAQGARRGHHHPQGDKGTDTDLAAGLSARLICPAHKRGGVRQSRGMPQEEV